LRIAALYKVEDAIRGSDPDRRRAVRQELSQPLVDEIFAWLTAQAKRVSCKTDLGEAMAYMLKRQDGLLRSGAFAAPLAPRSPSILDDGRVEMDTNPVENTIRPITLNRKNALFAPSGNFGTAKTLPGNGA
jgi:transposase